MVCHFTIKGIPIHHDDDDDDFDDQDDDNNMTTLKLVCTKSGFRFVDADLIIIWCQGLLQQY
jgi:hypothetical protein